MLNMLDVKMLEIGQILFTYELLSFFELEFIFDWVAI